MSRQKKDRWVSSTGLILLRPKALDVDDFTEYHLGLRLRYTYDVENSRFLLIGKLEEFVY